MPIEGLFLIQTLELVPLYSKILPEDSTLEFTLPSESSDPLSGMDDFDFDSTLVIFTETKTLELTNKFRKDADAYYVEAKRSTVSSVAQIPYWMYGVLVVLGWNEAMAVLFNPVYFTFLLIALAASLVSLNSRIFHSLPDEFFFSYIIVQLGMVGPLFRVLQGLAGEVRRCRLFAFVPFFTLAMRSYNVKRLLDYVNNFHSQCWRNPFPLLRPKRMGVEISSWKS